MVAGIHLHFKSGNILKNGGRWRHCYYRQSIGLLNSTISCDSLFRCNFSYRYAAVDKILTDLEHRVVHL